MTYRNFCLIAFTCWLVTACVTPLTPKAKSVKEMRTDWVSQNDCEFLTKELVESGWKFGASGNYKQVRNEMRIKTTELGGDVFVVDNLSGDGAGRYSATFAVYKCSSNN